MKVLISDFDYTLHTNDYVENVKKVNEFVKDGNMFIIATGRNYNFLLEEIKNDNINYEYLICNDGAIILNKNKEIIYLNEINKEILIDVIGEIDNLSGEYIFDDGVGYHQNKEGNIGAILVYKNKIDISKLLEIVKNNFLDLSFYETSNFIKILPKSSDKYYAIKYLEEKLGWKHENIFTVGDGENDILMNSNYNSFYIEDYAVDELKEKSKEGIKSVYQIIDKIN